MTKDKGFNIRQILFTVVLTSVAVGLIWYISGVPFHPYSIYKISTQKSISGLVVDAPVEFKGVDVGKVKSIEIKNSQLVEILVEIKKEIPITKGTVAILTARGLTSRGFTGFVYVDLQEEGSNNALLPTLPGHQYPIIPIKPSNIASLDSTIDQMNQNLLTMTELIHSVFDQENRDLFRTILLDLKEVTHTLSLHSQKLGSLLDNTEKVTGMLANNNQRLEAILINTEKASYHIEPFLKSGQNTLMMLESRTLPAASEALTNLNAVSNTLVNFVNELKQDPSVLIRGKAPPIPGPGETR